MPDEASYEIVENTNLQALAEDPSLVHFAAVLMPPRPGVQQCMTLLEFTHYPPGTVRNDLFQLRLVPWQGTLWAVVSLPKEDAELMQRSAELSGLRVVQAIPTMIAPDGAHVFPLASPSVYVLENTSEHPVYQSSDQEIREMLETERTYSAIIAGEKKPN